MSIATFSIVKNSQKGVEDFTSTFSPDILNEICLSLTGQTDYNVTYNDYGYNKGRLAELAYHGEIHYVMISPVKTNARNSSFQSVATAIGKFHREENNHKSLNYYIINSGDRINTPYHQFMYRLMVTAGVKFLNGHNFGISPVKFYSIQDLILAKENIRAKNKSNNSSFITIDENNTVQVFAKTYGASKKESTLLCIALAKIHNSALEVIQISEGNLKKLPQNDLELVLKLTNAIFITSDKEIEKEEFSTNNSLRSKTYIYNLLEKLGHKKCAMCECSIPQIIQAAHLWPVSEIKKSKKSDDIKLEHAIHTDNGLWLCENHHKLFDRNILAINTSGGILKTNLVVASHDAYISTITTSATIKPEYINKKFIYYIARRNIQLHLADYSAV